MIDARAYGSDSIAALTISAALCGAAATAALTIPSMLTNERVLSGRCKLKRNTFRAQTTILPARSGRRLAAVPTQARNFKPSNRTAVVMKLVRNLSLAVCAALFDARTVIGAVVVSLTEAEVCCAEVCVIERTAASARKTRRHPLFGPENIGILAALSLSSRSG